MCLSFINQLLLYFIPSYRVKEPFSLIYTRISSQPSSGIISHPEAIQAPPPFPQPEALNLLITQCFLTKPTKANNNKKGICVIFLLRARIFLLSESTEESQLDRL